MRMRGIALSLLVCAASTSSLAACVSNTPPPGMEPRPPRIHPENPTYDELARARPPAERRALLVVYPKTACSGSAPTVFVDGDGHYFGALAPGEASLLEVPARVQKLIAISSVEIVARPGTWFVVDDVDVPNAPDGILLRAWRPNMRNCGSGQYTDASIATKRELEAALADAPEIRWLAPRPAEGQAWLEEHRERLDELIGKAKPKEERRRVVTRRGP